ncbi:hypothetical protein KAS41_00195 [Candidatus Parcubacteria bacterium]|nr:hypothetical protein [Candidatus Parcubacteria bacterium]
MGENDGKWFLVFTVKAEGTDLVNEGWLSSEKVKIRLYASNKKEAEKQSKMILEEQNFPSKIQDLMDESDDYDFVDFNIIYEYIKTFPLKV